MLLHILIDQREYTQYCRRILKFSRTREKEKEEKNRGKCFTLNCYRKKDYFSSNLKYFTTRLKKKS